MLPHHSTTNFPPNLINSSFSDTPTLRHQQQYQPPENCISNICEPNNLKISTTTLIQIDSIPLTNTESRSDINIKDPTFDQLSLPQKLPQPKWTLPPLSSAVNIKPITNTEGMLYYLNAHRASLMTVDECVQFLCSDQTCGLSITEAEARKRSHGPNEFSMCDEVPLWKKFLEQFKNPLILLLLCSAFVSVCMAQFDDATSIALAVLIVSTVAFVQEYRSEKSLEELSKLLPDYCTCLRSYDNRFRPTLMREPPNYINETKAQTAPPTDNAMTLRIPARELVPGDLVLLKAGDRVPADLRLIRVRDLRVDESGFTGEAHPVKKSAEHLLGGPLPYTPANDGQIINNNDTQAHHTDFAHIHMKNIAFMGTLIRSGKAMGIVVGTGERTEFGEIFKLMKAEQEPKTPLQKSMDKLGKQLSFYSLIIIAIIIIIGYLRGRALLEMFTIGVSLAVAAIPEGLPIVVTVTLALGVIRMSKRRVIIKKLPTVETLGRVNVLCSDKTGTLTTNQMTVTDVLFASNSASATEAAIEHLKINDSSAFPTDLGIIQRTKTFQPQNYELEKGQIIEKGPGLNKEAEHDENVAIINSLDDIVNIACLCSDATDISASPTETALFDLAQKLAVNRQNAPIASYLQPFDYGKWTNYERIREIPFSSERKYMQVVCRTLQATPNPHIMVALKGAPEIILNKCDRYYSCPTAQNLNIHATSTNPITTKLTRESRAYFLGQAQAMAKNGLRVLAVAYNVHSIHRFENQNNEYNDGNHDSSLMKEGIDEISRDTAGFDNHIFFGFMGIQDPVKPNVPQVIADLKRIGIKVKMITGDSKETACSVARAIGLLHKSFSHTADLDDESLFLSGPQLDKLTTDELAQRIDRILVFYRTSPIHKIKIVKALQNEHTHKSNVVAMTGDGINDALALKSADIGIAIMAIAPNSSKSKNHLLPPEYSSIAPSSKHLNKQPMNDGLDSPIVANTQTVVVDILDHPDHMGMSQKDFLNDPVVINTNDACKEAADMLFLDGDLSSLAVCVDEGKTIYENIRNFLRFQLSTSISALALIALSTTFFMGPSTLYEQAHIGIHHNQSYLHDVIEPTETSYTELNTPVRSIDNHQKVHHHSISPLNAMQILWINIIMDGPPAQSLGVEPPDDEVINRPPRNVNDPMITLSLMSNILLSAFTIVTGTIWVFLREMRDGKITPRDTTMTFTCFVLFDMFNALSCRSQTKSIFSIGFCTNRIFIYSISGSIIAQVLVVYTPFFQRIFQTEAIGINDWVFLITLASSVFWLSELKKFIERHYLRRQFGDHSTLTNTPHSGFSNICRRFLGLGGKYNNQGTMYGKLNSDESLNTNSNGKASTRHIDVVESKSFSNSNSYHDRYHSHENDKFSYRNPRKMLRNALALPRNIVKKYSFLLIENSPTRHRSNDNNTINIATNRSSKPWLSTKDTYEMV